MSGNNGFVEMFNQLASAGAHFASGRPVPVDPVVVVADVSSKLPLTLKSRLLDVGCGTGLFTIPLSRVCGSICAMDAAARAVDVLRARMVEEGVGNIECSVGSVLDLPFEDACFDHVLMYSVLHYLVDEAQVKTCLRELVRVCRPGGSILIADIPDPKVRDAFEKRIKTEDELKRIEAYNNNRGEYDRIFKQNVHVTLDKHTFVLDIDQIMAWASELGCAGEVRTQDARLTFSLTRRDVLLKKGVL
ncbi:MAG: class I SAM-dependent methyltransferase [Candidatus Omnitrophica bacterium]|nr:class I SAM-dependent methyltransferase [Candidatus Omnitrophota bacterium]